jgi:hypothetical protein
MQRLITDPRNRPWTVQIEWLGRRIGRDTLLARYSRRRAGRRERKSRDAATLRSGQAPPVRKRRWFDVLDLDPGCLDVGEFPVALVVLLVIVLLIWLGPGALALLLGLGELLLVLLGALGVLLWRTLSRRPWAVVASDGDISYRWSVTGYRRARALVRSAAASLGAGLGLAGVDPKLNAGPARRTRRSDMQ